MELAERLQAALGATYRVEQAIGSGGMSTVYRARDVKHGRPVALKVLHGPLAAVLGPNRFRREIALAANLRHPHIVPVYDSGETPDGLLWFTMPYVAGETLRQRLIREHQLPLDDAIQIASDVGDAVDYAHRQGVVHRDLKPENILLADGHAMLGDFGIAALSGTVSDGAERGAVLGTPAYMSPEQARGLAVDERTDVYSLGAVVFEMLAGYPPTSAAAPEDVAAQLAEGGAPSVRDVRADVPPAADAALQRALARVPADRFETAAAFVAALRHSRTRGAGRARIWRVGAFAAVGAAVVALAFVAYHRTRETTAADAPVLAVLPFEDAGDTADAYIADGISDDIRGKLASLSDIQVIAGTSARQYRHTAKPPDQIARELGARYLLSGRTEWIRLPAGGQRLRVTPELIEIHAGRPPITRWERTFDVNVTDIFSVETDVATRVADALDVELSAEARARLARRPTANVEAWTAYQRGVALNYRGTNTEWQHRAAAELEHAAALDPAFVAAWAAAARTHAVAYLARVPPDPADSAAAHRDAERALALAPDLPDGYLAEGTFDQFVRQDFAASIRAYDAGLRRAPNDATLLGQLAFTEMRAGRWGDVLVHFAQARRLDPRSVSLAINLGMAYIYLHRYADARAVLDGAQALAPRSLARIQYRVEAALGAGDTADAHAVLHAALSVVDTTALVAYIGLADDLVWALDAPLARRLATLTPADFDGSRSDWAMVEAEASIFRGDTAQARAYADVAQTIYAAGLRTHPDDPELHALNGVALAYLGRHDAAIREGERAVALDPIERDGTLGAYLLQQLARIDAAVGESDRAMDALKRLLRSPGLISRGWLSVDPNFVRLRSLPWFERLVSHR